MAIATPVYGTRNPITCVAGRGTVAKTELLVATIADPLSGNPVTVTINNVTYTGVAGAPGANQFQLIPRGSPTVCWTGKITITSGLSAYTRYPWIVSQPGQPSDAGSLFIEPTDPSLQFVVETAGCDNASQGVGFANENNAEPFAVPGDWQYKKTRAQTSSVPTVGCAFVDDLGYVALMEIRDDGSSYSFGGESGKASSGALGTTPAGTGALNDYLIGWCALLGMLGPIQTAFTNQDLANIYLRRVLWAREENRAWCRKNFNFYTGPGDWEVSSDRGWDTEPVGTTWTNANAAWDAFYGLLKPPLEGTINGGLGKRDANARHWVFKIGNLVLACLDGMMNASRVSWATDAVPNGTYTDQGSLTRFTTIYGQNQMYDVLDAINSLAGKHTVLLMAHSHRYPIPRTGGPVAPLAFANTIYGFPYQVHEWGSGAQHPLYDHALRDHQILFTQSGQTPPSLMDNPYTNGKRGSLTTLHYDYHHGQVAWMHHPAYTDATYGSQLAEKWYSLNPGTTNGSAYFGSGVTMSQSEVTVAEMTFEYDDQTHYQGNTTFHGLSLTIGDGYWLQARLNDHWNTTLWEKKFAPASANYTFPINWQMNVGQARQTA